MSIAIKSYTAPIPAYVPIRDKFSSENSDSTFALAPNSNAAVTLSISDAARALYSLGSEDEPPVQIPNKELKDSYVKGQLDVYNFGQLIAGRNYNKEDLLPKTDDSERSKLGQESLNYAIGLSQIPTKNVPNPFSGMARNDLSAIVYSDNGSYTDAERYAAYGELSKQDEAYFSQLYAKVTNGGDNRDIFKGIMDYFDELPPVEKSAYREGFRESIDSLYQEQTEQWGPLVLMKQPAGGNDAELSENATNEAHARNATLRSVLERAFVVVNPSRTLR